ncbi:MAG: hypothetical protein O3B25_15430 [Verrucomicrobia bacterium]|nr:hypothetical protein [Verrucomicrobiota bacterium]
MTVRTALRLSSAPVPHTQFGADQQTERIAKLSSPDPSASLVEGQGLGLPGGWSEGGTWFAFFVTKDFFNLPIPIKPHLISLKRATE